VRLSDLGYVLLAVLVWAVAGFASRLAPQEFLGSTTFAIARTVFYPWLATNIAGAILSRRTEPLDQSLRFEVKVAAAGLLLGSSVVTWFLFGDPGLTFSLAELVSFLMRIGPLGWLWLLFWQFGAPLLVLVGWRRWDAWRRTQAARSAGGAG